MLSTQPARTRDCLIGLIFILVVQGCAHTPLSPLPESLQLQLGKIGVVVRSTDEQHAFSASGTGRLSDIGRGAGIGMTMGAAAGAHGGMAAPLTFPAGAALGLAVGTLYGAVVSEPWQDEEATFRTIVGELDLNQTLPEHLAAFARLHGYEITHLTTAPPVTSQDRARDATAREDGVDTVIEIQDLTVHLVPAEYKVTPYRRLTLSAHVLLVHAGEGTVLDDRVATEELGPALEMAAWTADHSTRFREEVRHASERLAEQIVTEYFMIYRFPERTIRKDFRSDFHLKGLRSRQPAELGRTFATVRDLDQDLQKKYASSTWLSLTSPIPPEFYMLAQMGDSQQPTLSWEPFSKTNVTYDLRVWEAGRAGPGKLVYDRAGIDQTSHRLEEALEAGTFYYWSVRARYSEHGRTRITEWSRRSVQFSLSSKVLTLGIVALFPDFVPEGFYVFRTPK